MGLGLACFSLRMHRLQDVVPTTWARCSACRHRGPPAPCMPPITESSSSSFVIAGVVFARARARWNRPVQLLPRESSERKRKQLPLTWTARVPVPFFESVNDNIWPWRLSNPDCNNTLSAAERWALDYCAGCLVPSGKIMLALKATVPPGHTLDLKAAAPCRQAQRSTSSSTTLTTSGSECAGCAAMDWRRDGRQAAPHLDRRPASLASPFPCIPLFAECNPPLAGHGSPE